MARAVIEVHDPWTPSKDRVEYRELDLLAFGAEIVPATGVRIFVRKLRFAEGLRLGQWVSRTLGSVIGALLAAIFEASGREGASEQIRAEIAAALPLAVEALAGAEDWYTLLIERARGVATYSPAGTRDPAQPGGLFQLDADALEEIFSPAPAEGLLLLLALVAEGVGPLPLLARGRPASQTS